jgi:metal-sulfur cluster biosynthetic enzyme/ribosomal protein L22
MTRQEGAMSTIFAAQWQVDEPQLRVTEGDARSALRRIAGQPAVSARARLRFGPGRTCEPVARLLDRAIVQAEAAGLDPALLVVADGSARAAEDIVRVRRKDGIADWIHSPTCQVRIILRPAGLHATSGANLGPTPQAPSITQPATSGADPLPAPEAVPATPPAVADALADERADAVREALAEVIDPDLGVNIVDLGFVRAVEIRDRTAVITMTLTSAACPLSQIMEAQIRTALDSLGGIDGFRVDWQWVPAWRPADITDSGRDQLRAIGFSC